MKDNSYITLLDPSIQDNSGIDSDNLGDLIIYQSIKQILEDLFPGKEIKRISTHQYLQKKETGIINDSLFAFVGGTNILTSDIRNFPRLSPVKRKGFYLFPGFRNLVLLGTGWSAYQPPVDLPTRIYYKQILKKKILHSVRDTYSQTMLNNAGFKNVIHTSCPTTWNLDTGFINKFDPAVNRILFTLTSYYPDPAADEKLIEIILGSSAKEIYFFPQTKKDIQYLESLPIYKKNFPRFNLMNHTITELNGLVSATNFNYIGNRLHCGIKCLAFNRPALIVSVDNRAIEMGKSIQLNTVNRNELSHINKWIGGEYIPPPVNLPVENIREWKNQFA